MADVFISYSRKDGEFVQRLNNAFVGVNRIVWVDWQSIPRGEDWWHEIESGIEGGDAFLVILSEHWLSSEICHRELLSARENNKRVLPLIRSQVRGEIEQRVKGQWMDQPYEQAARENWDYLRHLNWVFFDDDSKFDAEFTALLKALDEDQPHIKAHTRYQSRALEWVRSGRNPSFLLSGDDLTFAENWSKIAAAKTPAPTAIQDTFITESRRADDSRKAIEVARERRILQFRRAAIVLGIVGLLAIIATAIAVPAGINALNTNATSNAQLATATNALVTATHVAQQVAAGEIALATAQTSAAVIRSTLAPVPATLTALADTVNRTKRDQAITVQESIADERINNGYVGEARRIGDKLIEDYPDDANAYFARANILGKLGDYESALAAYTTSIQLDPESSRAYNGRASVYSSLDQPENAIADYTRAIEIAPQEAYLLGNRGVVYEGLGQMDAALADYSSAVELAPDNASAYVNRARVYNSLGRPEESIADFTRAIELDPLDADTYMSRAAAYYAQGQYEESIADCSRAIELEPQYTLGYSQRAAAYSALGQLEEAVADYSRAIQIDPTDPTDFNNRAAMYTGLGQFDEAIADYSRAIELDPSYDNAYVARGGLYLDQGRLDEALADYTYAIEIAPENLVSYINRSTIYTQQGKYDEGIADLNRAIELTPSGQMIPNAYVNRGWIYYLQGDLDSALDDFNYLLRVVPDDLYGLTNRALVYIFQGQYDLAYFDYVDALINESVQPTGIIDTAIIDLTDALEKNPQNPALYVFRGYLAHAQGNLDQASADWTKAEELNAEFPRGIRLLYDQLKGS